MTKLQLNGEYRLYSYDCKAAPEHPEQLTGDYLIAQVPGNVELDYQKAGLLPDLYYEENWHAAEKLEKLDFWYVREFSVPEEMCQKALWLHFEGVDTIAEYFVNGLHVGSSDNMFIAHEFPVSQAIRPGTNTLAVHIYSAVEYARKYEIRPFNVAFSRCFENLYVRKAAINYGWDISPRMLSAGIWKDVWLEERENARFKDVYLTTASVYENVAVLVLTCNAELPDAVFGKCKLRMEASCGDHQVTLEYPFLHGSTTVYPYIKNAKLWYPLGMGEQNLYDVRLSILCEDQVVTEYTMRYGIRKAQLKFGEAIGEEGKFALYINNRLCRCRGANWVPISLFHSQAKGQYAGKLQNFVDANCNILRVWGGGVYEQDEFFDLCDELGIMVWQDIMLACHAYPMTDAFYQAMCKECESVAKRIRNHPSLVLYCGGNETDWPYVCVGLDPNDDKISRGAIQDTLFQFDPYRNYLPSTPYFSREFIKKHGGRFYLDLDEIETERASLPQEHYWWKREDFLGVRKQNHKFISEIGYPGIAARESVDAIMHEGYSFEEAVARDHNMYAGGPRTSSGMELLFDNIPETDYDKFQASQYYQAEAYKFITELCRMRDYQNGIILWTMRENWPNTVSLDLVDYADRRKKAFYAVKAAYEPVQCMIDIQDQTADLYLINDRMDGKTYQVTVTDEAGNCLYCGEIATNINTQVYALGSISLNHEKLLLTEVTGDGSKIGNYRYVYQNRISYPEYREQVDACLQEIYQG